MDVVLMPGKWQLLAVWQLLCSLPLSHLSPTWSTKTTHLRPTQALNPTTECGIAFHIIVLFYKSTWKGLSVLKVAGWNKWMSVEFSTRPAELVRMTLHVQVLLRVLSFICSLVPSLLSAPFLLSLLLWFPTFSPPPPVYQCPTIIDLKELCYSLNTYLNPQLMTNTVK